MLSIHLLVLYQLGWILFILTTVNNTNNIQTYPAYACHSVHAQAQDQIVHVPAAQPAAGAGEKCTKCMM